MFTLNVGNTQRGWFLSFLTDYNLEKYNFNIFVRYFSGDSVDTSVPMKVFPGTHDKLGGYAARLVCMDFVLNPPFLLYPPASSSSPSPSSSPSHLPTYLIPSISSRLPALLPTSSSSLLRQTLVSKKDLKG